MSARVLVIDDGEDYARIVQEQLPEFRLVKPGGNKMRLPDGKAALRYLAKHHQKVDVVLLDVNFDIPEDRLLPLSNADSLRRRRRFQGVAIYRELRRRFSHLPVVMLTAQEDLSLVDAGGELGAQSLTYFLDRDDLDTLRIRINAALQEAAQGLEEEGVLWGGDRRMQQLRRRLSVLARGSLPVILEGETGTGKSYLAERFLHQNSGRKGAFVVADLSTVPSSLVPAYLFGAVRGAFTGATADRPGVFEMAHRGTLFIDEVQNIPPEVQKQLLVTLQDKRVRPLGSTREIYVDVKVVAGANEPLSKAVADGRFRQDLYMRLGPATRVELPPLRERRKDLPFFVRRLVAEAGRHADHRELCHEVALAAGVADPSAPLQLMVGREPSTSPGLSLAIPKPAWSRILSHTWPGNMRELSMVIHQIVTFTLVGAVDALRAGSPLRSSRLQVDVGLVQELLEASQPHASEPDASAYRVTLAPQESLNAVTVEVERQYFRALFQQTQGDFARMADILLGDPDKGRAVRLRFNQIGLRVRELRTWN